MLTRCYADNYRCLGAEPLRFGPLCVLLGPNGSGKSTWLDLIARLRDFILGKDTALTLFPRASLTRWDTRNEQTFELGARLGQGEYLYRLRISHRREQGKNMVIEETLKLDGQPLLDSNTERMTLYNDRLGGGVPFQPDWRVSGLSRVDERHDNTKLIAFRRFIESILVLALNPGLVRAISNEEQPVTIPKPDCS